LCLNTQQHHQQQQGHEDNVARFITWAFKVVGARTLIRRYGIEAVHQVALELHEAAGTGALRGIRNPGGFFVWKVRDLAGEQQSAHLHVVEQPDQKSTKGGMY